VDTHRSVFLNMLSHPSVLDVGVDHGIGRRPVCAYSPRILGTRQSSHRDAGGNVFGVKVDAGQDHPQGFVDLCRVVVPVDRRDRTSRSASQGVPARLRSPATTISVGAVNRAIP